MKILRALILAVGMILMVSSASYSQNDFTTQLSKMLKANATNYLEPLASGLGAGLNSGLYHSADLHSVLGFDIGIKVGLAAVADEHKTFDFVLPSTIGPCVSSGTFSMVEPGSWPTSAKLRMNLGLAGSERS